MWMEKVLLSVLLFHYSTRETKIEQTISYFIPLDDQLRLVPEIISLLSYFTKDRFHKYDPQTSSDTSHEQVKFYKCGLVIKGGTSGLRDHKQKRHSY
jgi:hypothetical protein